MPSPRTLLFCAACALLSLTACTGVTEITAPVDEAPEDSAGDEPTELALVDETATTDPVEEAPTAEPTADIVEDPVEPVEADPVDVDEPTEQPEWVWWDVDGAYGMNVPGALDTKLWFDSELDLFVEQSKETGLAFPRQLISEYKTILQTSQGIVFFGPDGDTLTAHRSFGAANELVYHEKTVDDLTLQYSSFASNVDFTSEPRMFSQTPGVLIRGSYDVESDRWYHYSFHTHSGAYLYYFTISLTGEDDPEMVTDFFRSVEITG